MRIHHDIAGLRAALPGGRQDAFVPTMGNRHEGHLTLVQVAHRGHEGDLAAARARLAEFGSAIGLAFQLTDDLLDLTSDTTTMGKATGKDEAAGKATLVRLHGVDWARKQLGGLVAQAHDLLKPYGADAAALKSAASFIAARRR